MASRERVVALEIVLIIDILVLRFVIVADIHIFVSLVAHRQIEDIYNTLCVHDDNDDDDEVCVDSNSIHYELYNDTIRYTKTKMKNPIHVFVYLLSSS